MKFEIALSASDVTVSYDLDWLGQVMTASASSMVPFSTAAAILADRSYARASRSSFTMFTDTTKNTPDAPSHGGRPAAYPDVAKICKLLSSNQDVLPVSDIAILAKRALCQRVNDSRTRFTNFTIFENPHLHVVVQKAKKKTQAPAERLPVYLYPMVCVQITKPEVEPAGLHASVLQCVFGAELTRQLRAEKIGIEVVSRQGFGSLFPTLAGLLQGFRLDPGLLPSVKGARAIVDALAVTDLFDTLFRKSPFLATVKKDLGKHPWVKNFGAMNAPELQMVDHLMIAMHKAVIRPTDKPAAVASAYLTVLSSFGGHKPTHSFSPIDGDVDTSFTCDDPRLPKHFLKTYKTWKARRSSGSVYTTDIDGGYGSDSDYESDADEVQPSTSALKPRAKEEAVSLAQGRAIKKVAVVSGMAALRMAILYALAHSQWQLRQSSKSEKVHPIRTWAPYFEVEFDNLLEPLRTILKEDGADVVLTEPKWTKQARAGTLFFDGAPNPINTTLDNPPPFLEELKDLLAIVVDTTNNTSAEKARYIEQLSPLLHQDSGLLLLVESVSKHPTGGDLVHGVIRVCGPRPLVESFAETFLKGHIAQKIDLALSTKEEFKASPEALAQTVLNIAETEARQGMKNSRLLTRNRDLWDVLHAMRA